VNPKGIVPSGPIIDDAAAHDRAAVSARGERPI